MILDGDADGELPSPGALPVVIASVGSELGGKGPSAADLVIGAGDGVVFVKCA